MKKRINLIVNISAFVFFLLSSVTGVVLCIFLPSGQGPGGGRYLFEENVFLGLFRHQWNYIHTYASLALIVLVFIHLILHWIWIKNIPKFFRN